jgi:aminoglycoside phosphotransferase (APT) family kinase protein
MSPTAYEAIADQLFPGSVLEFMERLTGGVSADVYRCDLRLADGTRHPVVLRVHGATHSGHSAELEYQLLEALHRKDIPVPKPLMVDTSGRLLKDPYLVMSFVDGTTTIPARKERGHIEVMAGTLKKIHGSSTSDLPDLPGRNNPLPEVLEYLPAGPDWTDLRNHLESRQVETYRGAPKLLHGDFWPENLLWRDGSVVAVLDWEDAAIGDPLSDVAAARVELRYRFGKQAMAWFTEAYTRQEALDPERLALWQVYVASAAQRFMGEWGLEPSLEAHMRREALASIREAGDELMRSGGAQRICR